MKLSRLTGFAATALLSSLFLTGCGGAFRPVVNPVPSPTPDPQQAGIAVVLQSAGSLNGGISCVDGSPLPCRPGAATQIDVSGDTVLNNQENAGIGRNPVHATFVTSGTNTFAQVVVANHDSDNVSVYNPSFTFTPSVVSLAANAHPVFVAATPNGAKAYVANSGTNTVSVVTPALATLAATIDNLGSSPKVMAVSADGSKVYVANTDGSVSVIPTASNPAAVPTKVLSPGGTPAWAEANSAGTAIFVLYPSLSQVNVIDLTTDPNVFSSTTLPVDSGSNYMVFDRNLQRLYVNGSSHVYVFDAHTAVPNPTPLSVVPMPSTPVSMTVLANGTSLYVVTDGTCAGSGAMFALNASAFTLSSCIPVGDNPVWIAASSDSKKLYVAHKGDGVTLLINGVSVPQPVGTTIISTTTNQVVTEIPASFQDPACTTACTYELPVFVMANR